MTAVEGGDGGCGRPNAARRHCGSVAPTIAQDCEDCLGDMKAGMAAAGDSMPRVDTAGR